MGGTTVASRGTAMLRLVRHTCSLHCAVTEQRGGWVSHLARSRLRPQSESLKE